MKSEGGNNARKLAGALITAAVLLLGGSQALPAIQNSNNSKDVYSTEAQAEISDEYSEESSEYIESEADAVVNSDSREENTDSESSDIEVNNDKIQTGLRFRNKKLLNQHYEKHGIEMGFSSAKDYEAAASEVPASEEALHKTEKEDGDDVYYIEDTNEFVVVSTDGYIRTFFNPNSGIKYYNKQ